MPEGSRFQQETVKNIQKDISCVHLLKTSTIYYYSFPFAAANHIYPFNAHAYRRKLNSLLNERKISDDNPDNNMLLLIHESDTTEFVFFFFIFIFV